MAFDMNYDIDTIVVNPSDEERIRDSFLSRGLKNLADIIITNDCAPKGKLFMYDKDKLMNLEFKI